LLKLVIVTRDGVEHEVESKGGQSVMEAIRDAGFDELQAVCGGGLSCATCHVHVDEAYLGRFAAPNQDEADLLEWSENSNACSRLSCQLPFTEDVDGLKITIAQED
jgi:ferredoxin, 2Fe-2S